MSESAVMLHKVTIALLGLWAPIVTLCYYFLWQAIGYKLLQLFYLLVVMQMVGIIPLGLALNRWHRESGILTARRQLFDWVIAIAVGACLALASLGAFIKLSANDLPV